MCLLLGKSDVKAERILKSMLSQCRLGNSFKEDGIFGEDINIVQPKSSYPRGSAHINLTVASLANTILPPFLKVY